MNLLGKVIKEAAEGSGEVELRIRIRRDTTVGELQEKLSALLTVFSPEDIKVVPVRELDIEEQIEIANSIAEEIVKTTTPDDLMKFAKKTIEELKKGAEGNENLRAHSDDLSTCRGDREHEHGLQVWSVQQCKANSSRS